MTGCKEDCECIRCHAVRCDECFCECIAMQNLWKNKTKTNRKYYIFSMISFLEPPCEHLEKKFMGAEVK